MYEIKIPEDDLQGCHNCRWSEDEKYRCLAGVDCEWEPRDQTSDSKEDEVLYPLKGDRKC